MVTACLGTHYSSMFKLLLYHKDKCDRLVGNKQCNRKTCLERLQSTITEICVTKSVCSYFTSKFNIYNLSIKNNEQKLCCTVSDFRKSSLPETYTSTEICISRNSPHTQIPQFIGCAYVYITYTYKFKTLFPSVLISNTMKIV